MMLACDVGLPEPLLMFNPATLPFINSEASRFDPKVKSFDLTLVTELVTSPFF